MKRVKSAHKTPENDILRKLCMVHEERRRRESNKRKFKSVEREREIDRSILHLDGSSVREL